MTRLEQLAEASMKALMDTPEEPSPFDWGDPYKQGFIAGAKAAMDECIHILHAYSPSSAEQYESEIRRSLATEPAAKGDE